MIEMLKFENFRGFKKIELSELKPITLISGKNNTGKSSILEGIFLFLDHISPDCFSKINYFRGTTIPNNSLLLWESIFYHMDTGKQLQISMKKENIFSSLTYLRDDTFIPPNDINTSPEMMNQIIFSAKSAYTLKFQYQRGIYSEDGHFIASPAGMVRNITTSLVHNQIDPMPSAYFINSAIINSNNSLIAEWFGRVELEGKKQQVVNILQLIEPEIYDLSTIAANNQVQLYVKIGQQLLPLRLAGDGLNRLLYLILSIVANPDNIILIDEIETGFHYSMFPKLWESISKAALENNCQIIATTHSYECIVGAIDGIEKADRKSDFCYLRIDKIENGNLAILYSADLLKAAVMTNMEVR